MKSIKSIFEEPIFFTTKVVTDYDKNSVMNYCYMSTQMKSSSRASLSTLDKETLKYLYP